MVFDKQRLACIRTGECTMFLGVFSGFISAWKKRGSLPVEWKMRKPYFAGCFSADEASTRFCLFHTTHIFAACASLTLSRGRELTSFSEVLRVWRAWIQHIDEFLMYWQSALILVIFQCLWNWYLLQTPRNTMLGKLHVFFFPSSWKNRCWGIIRYRWRSWLCPYRVTIWRSMECPCYWHGQKHAGQAYGCILW